jgi:hypothetical protein
MSDTMTGNRRVAKILGIAGPLLIIAWLAADLLWRRHHGGSQPGATMVFWFWLVCAVLSGGRLTISAREIKIAAGFIAVCLAGEAVLMHFARHQPLGGWADMGTGFWPIILGIGWLCLSLRRGFRMSGMGSSFLWMLVFMTMVFAQDVLSPQFWHGAAHPSGWVVVGWVAAIAGGAISGLGTRLEPPSNQRPIADS